MECYEKYKNSGVEWIGDIPAGPFISTPCVRPLRRGLSWMFCKTTPPIPMADTLIS